MTETRRYESPAREQAKAQTREKIVDAVIRIILDEGLSAFTVQNVADKAGVSHRTVYRHFKTREDLLEGLVQFLDSSAANVPLPSIPRNLDDVLATVGPSLAGMSRVADAVRAYVIASLALQWQDEARKKRSRAFTKVIREAFPNLTAPEQREAAAMIRSLASTRSWYQLTVEGGLDGAAAAGAADWAVRALVKDLSRRDQTAKKRKS